MGNSADNRVNLLAKNWQKVNSHTFKNTITQELIDSYELQAHSQEELAYYNSLLIKRAAINHSNVLKLIYFYQEQQSLVMCSNKKYNYKIYTEHSSGTIASLLAVDRNDSDLCHCCSVMSGIGCLVEKYGYFGVSPGMIFMVNSVGLSKVDQKKTPKVWINEDLRINHSEQICNQEQMCFHLFQLFQLIVQHNLCSKIDFNEMSKHRRFKDFFQFIFITHKKQPSERKVERKRVTSQLNGFEVNKLQKNQASTQPNIKVNHLHIKHINTFPTNNSTSQSMIHMVNSTINFADREYKESIKIGKNSQFAASQQTLFMKKDGAVKEVDLLNKSFQKVEKNKVNFSYTDSLATPKNNKSYKETKTAQLLQSPHEELASVYFRSSKNRCQAQKITPKREIPPFISFFNSNPKPQQNVFTQKIQHYSPEFNLKRSGLQRQRNQNRSQGLRLCQQRKLEQKPFEIKKQKDQPAQPVIRELFTEAKVKKQKKLKFQKCIDLQCVVPLDSSKKSTESHKNKSMGGFQIAKEYCLSIEPQPKVPSIKINQSEDFVSDSIEISSARNIRQKADNLTANFFREYQMQREQSVQSEIFNPFSNSSVYPYMLKEDFSRKGSLPASQQNYDKKYNIYMHKLEDFSKGITNSIKSNGTKRSLPEDSYEVYRVSQNQLRTANIDHREFFGNNMAVYENKREGKNNRSSDVDSYFSESESLQERKKVQILQKISNTERILEENKKKLQKLQLQKDLQIEKDMIKKEMDTLLKNNMMVDESHRIKQKVKHKKATFAELKAEAAKILNDLNL